MAEISVAKLYRDTYRKLRLKWVAGQDGGDNPLTSDTVTKPSLALIGHLNFVHPNRVQVLGCAEMDYLRSLSAADMKQSIANLFSTDLAAGVVANGEVPPKALLQAADSHHTPLFTSPQQSPRLMDVLSHYLAQTVASCNQLQRQLTLADGRITLNHHAKALHLHEHAMATGRLCYRLRQIVAQHIHQARALLWRGK